MDRDGKSETKEDYAAFINCIPYTGYKETVLNTDYYSLEGKETLFFSNSNSIYYYYGNKVTEDELEAKIPINTVPFILGSGKENVDYRFNRRSVSRLHARIFAEGDRYFIEDLDSTNGTRVNKKKLAPHEIVEIRDGDIITISDVEMSYYNS